MKPDTLIAALAFIVAVISFLYTVEQHQTAREHNRLSVVPHLVFRPVLDHKTLTYSLGVKNTGLGPARKTSFHLELDDRKVSVDSKGGWETVFEQLTELDRIATRDFDWFVPGDGLSPGTLFKLLEIRLPLKEIESEFNDLPSANPGEPEILNANKLKLFDEFKWNKLKALSRIKVIIQYESFYGESALLARRQVYISK